MEPAMSADPLDNLDRAVLSRLSSIYGRVDPPPPDLNDRVMFAIALDDLVVERRDVEVARLGGDQLVGSGARAAERIRTITFDAASRTVMMTIADRPDNLVRIDGWLAPGEAVRVELRLPEPSAARHAYADDTGRFVFEGVPHGLAQVLVHPPSGTDRPVLVTPSLVL
jgi:hypothetical protein